MSHSGWAKSHLFLCVKAPGWGQAWQAAEECLISTVGDFMMQKALQLC